MSARHRTDASRLPGAAALAAVVLAAGGAGLLGGLALGPGAALRTEATAATPTPTATATPRADPTAAARSLRAVRDLSAGDTLLYYPAPYGKGSPCTFVAFESASPKFARVDCGEGQVNVKVCDIASTTPYSLPSAT